MKPALLATAATLATLTAGAASASLIYSNVTASSGSLSAISFWNGHFADADSFTVSSASVASSLTFESWNLPSDPLTSVTWDIYTQNPFTCGSCSAVASGTFDPSSSLVGPISGYDLYDNTVDLGSVSLSPGSYWLELSGGVTVGGNNVFWDLSNGPSAGWNNSVGNLDTFFTSFPGTGSETFSISGTTGTPEPAAWALMLAGFAGLGAALRARRRLSPA